MSLITRDWLVDFDWAAECADYHEVSYALTELLVWSGFKRSDQKVPEAEAAEARNLWRDILAEEKPAIASHIQANTSVDELKALAYEFYAVIYNVTLTDPLDSLDLRSVAFAKNAVIQRVCESYLANAGGAPRPEKSNVIDSRKKLPSLNLPSAKTLAGPLPPLEAQVIKFAPRKK